MIVIGVSLLVALLLVEIALRGLKSVWLQDQRHRLTLNLSAFFQASDDQVRQRLILLSARTTLVFSLALFALIALLAFIAWLPVALLGFNATEQTNYVVVLSVVAMLWWLLRDKVLGLLSRINATETANPSDLRSNYSLLERRLHWLVLEPLSVRRLAFDLERQFFLPKTKNQNAAEKTNPAEDAVYICGLARSGTTMVLRILDQTGYFRSLSYRDMPFVMAPNLWKLITRYSPKEIVAVERAHGDGMVVNADSPEAFEEVFWDTFRTDKPNTRCFGNTPSDEAMTAFADYRTIVASPKSDLPGHPHYRYLSKNNNNLLRLDRLSEAPSGTILLVFRNPITTAYSLYEQHQRFCATHRVDRFTQHYMTWLAHHEFGLGYRPFCFALAEMNPSLTPTDPNYWLDYWNAVYRYVLTKQNLRIHLVDYDALCTQPAKGLKVIFNQLSIDAGVAPFAKEIYPPRSESPCIAVFDANLIHQAREIHRALLDSPLNLV